MLRIVNAKSGYMVVMTSRNGQVLSTSEVLKAKKNAVVNIMAQAKCFDHGSFHFQDETLPKPKRYIVTSTGVVFQSQKRPLQPYKPKKK